MKERDKMGLKKSTLFCETTEYLPIGKSTRLRVVQITLYDKKKEESEIWDYDNEENLESYGTMNNHRQVIYSPGKQGGFEDFTMYLTEYWPVTNKIKYLIRMDKDGSKEIAELLYDEKGKYTGQITSRDGQVIESENIVEDGSITNFSYSLNSSELFCISRIKIKENKTFLIKEFSGTYSDGRTTITDRIAHDKVKFRITWEKQFEGGFYIEEITECNNYWQHKCSKTFDINGELILINRIEPYKDVLSITYFLKDKKLIKIEKRYEAFEYE